MTKEMNNKNLNLIKYIRDLIKKVIFRKVQKAELNWWKKKGVAYGRKHYPLYYKIFKFENYNFRESVIIDVGGGMYPIHLDWICKKKILIDPLIYEYFKIDGFVASKEVAYYKNFRQLMDNIEIADVVCCFNTLDHALDPYEVVNGIYNSLRGDGLFFIYSHIGNPLGGFQHPHCFFRKDYLSMLSGKFKIVKEYDVEDEEIKRIEDIPAFAAVCKKY